VDFIQYSNDPALGPAQELFERINERKLYVCVGKTYINTCTYMYLFQRMDERKLHDCVSNICIYIYINIFMYI
jgi:hypothetical protein